ncbi:hypothetical protein DFR50_1253 [Roseiarcus fermentans]|uniref:Uncharacterized protein n=1 Tax=Roseiarcus fermentans TaxID=1473586 RepID=A0A366F1I0_9HYPH|nr:hypothetical protein [Roseiarcus fermentans]RBP08522.1 hypothetical protein DFR50_1253 [Roseiarcus fermentans]
MTQHGDKRPGAGRPKGAKTRRPEPAPPPPDLPGDPLSVGLRAMRQLEAEGKAEKAGALAVRLARYFQQPFAPTDQAARPHPEQGILPLWESKAKPAPTPGKKEIARQEAETAGEGTEWGDLLRPDRPN